MSRQPKRRREMGRLRPVAIVLGGLLALAVASLWPYKPTSAATQGGGGPFSNQPIVLSWDDSQLAVANPDAGTVSVFQVAGDKNTKVSEVAVGKEPIGVAWSSDGNTLYVANQADGTVSVVLKNTGGGGYGGAGVTTIAVGTEPHGMVLSASGRKLYVTNT